VPRTTGCRCLQWARPPTEQVRQRRPCPGLRPGTIRSRRRRTGWGTSWDTRAAGGFGRPRARRWSSIALVAAPGVPGRGTLHGHLAPPEHHDVELPDACSRSVGRLQRASAAYRAAAASTSGPSGPSEAGIGWTREGFTDTASSRASPGCVSFRSGSPAAGAIVAPPQVQVAPSRRCPWRGSYSANEHLRAHSTPGQTMSVCPRADWARGWP